MDLRIRQDSVRFQNGNEQHNSEILEEDEDVIKIRIPEMLADRMGNLNYNQIILVREDDGVFAYIHKMEDREDYQKALDRGGRIPTDSTIHTRSASDVPKKYQRKDRTDQKKANAARQVRELTRKKKFQALQLHQQSENIQDLIVNDYKLDLEERSRLGKMVNLYCESWKTYQDRKWNITRIDELELMMIQHKNLLEEPKVEKKYWRMISRSDFNFDKLYHEHNSIIADYILKTAEGFRNVAEDIYTISKDRNLANQWIERGWKVLKKMKMPSMKLSENSDDPKVDLSLENAINLMTNISAIRKDACEFLSGIRKYNNTKYTTVTEILRRIDNELSGYGLEHKFRYDQDWKTFEDLQPNEAIWKGLTDLI